jgi:hypothetical protein
LLCVPAIDLAGGGRAASAAAAATTASRTPKPSYQFWILAPGATSWTKVQAYSITNTFSWVTTGKPAGTYNISVRIRDAQSTGTSGNSSGTWDAYNFSTYTLT